MASNPGSGNGNGNEALLNMPSPKRLRLSLLESEVKSQLGQLRSVSFPSALHESVREKENVKEKEKEKEEDEDEDEDEEEEEEEEGEGEGEEEEEEGEEEEEEEGDEEEEEISEWSKTGHSAFITNVKAFDCPGCNGPLLSPIYQCSAGHVACGKCCTKEGTKPITCNNGSCRRRTGTIRCYALEKVLESVTFPCPNTAHGCKKTFKNSKILSHEKTCVYCPCACPYTKCDYVGLSLYKHFGQAHPHSESSDIGQLQSQFSFDAVKSILLRPYQKQVFLQDSSRTSLFVLDRTNSSSGSFLSVVCLAPEWSKKEAFLYELTAEVDSETSAKMKARVQCMSKWTAEKSSGNSLVLTKDLVKNFTDLKLELIIRKNLKFAG